MKRSIFILASALVIFIITLFITNDYMSDETIHEADRINELQINELTKRMELNILIREKAVHSFLSGIFYYDFHNNKDKKDTLIYISEKDERRFKNNVYDCLHDFLKLNPHTQCAAFIIDPSVYPEKGSHGFAPLIENGDTTHYDIAKNFNFFTSKIYHYAVTTRHCVWSMPAKESPLYENSIIYYVPIMRHSGTVFGVFAITVTLNAIRNGLIETLSNYNYDSDILIADNNGRIILSTDKFSEKFNKVSDYTAFLKAATKYHKLKEDSIHHDVVSVDGNEHFIYHRNLESVPWKVIGISNKNLVYKNVIRTRYVILIVSAIGMLLMLLCCVVVFRREKKNIRQRAAAEDEIKMAANVQQSMLKPTTFSVGQLNLNAFIRPAREAGGDLYDYLEHDGKLLFCIGDVSGKGMAAALFMAQVVSLFRNACNYTTDPDQMVSQINDVLVENNPNMTFCTLFVGVIDHNRQTLTFCNAGHNRPVVIPDPDPLRLPQGGENKLANNPLDSLPLGGVGGGQLPHFLPVKPNIAIGLMPHYPYKAETIDLTSISSILLYTDGVTEAKNVAHEQYGEQRLIDTMSKAGNVTTADRINALLSSLDTFVNGYEQSDDITIMAIS